MTQRYIIVEFSGWHEAVLSVLSLNKTLIKAHGLAGASSLSIGATCRLIDMLIRVLSFVHELLKEMMPIQYYFRLMLFVHLFDC